MKLLIACVVIAITFCSCSSKFVRKKIQTNEVILRWYYYSDLTTNSPDIVELEKDGEVKKIYKMYLRILDVNMNSDSIRIKLIKPLKEYPVPPLANDMVFGYKIILDTTGQDTDLTFIPKGIKE